MSTANPSDRPAYGAGPWTWLALLVSLGAVAGSLYLSLGMGLKACPLCLYQRTFVFGTVGILVVGLLTGSARPGLLSLLALPLAAGGLGVAGFHVYLEAIGKLECPAGVAGIGSAPQQALAVLVLLVVVLLLDVLGTGKGLGIVAVIATLVLGGLFAWGLIASAPPAPRPPEGGYPVPINQDGCRPPAKTAP